MLNDTWSNFETATWFTELPVNYDPDKLNFQDVPSVMPQRNPGVVSKWRTICILKQIRHLTQGTKKSYPKLEPYLEDILFLRVKHFIVFQLIYFVGSYLICMKKSRKRDVLYIILQLWRIFLLSSELSPFCTIWWQFWSIYIYTKYTLHTYI